MPGGEIMELVKLNDGFKLLYQDKCIIHHTAENPSIYIGYGNETVEMYRGNFDIKDYVIERYPLKSFTIQKINNGYSLNFDNKLTANIKIEDNRFLMDFEKKDDKINRFWIRIDADENEKCFGCGEQMSYFNLRGRNFPLWTSEPGVGRDKTTYVTWRSDVENKAGGDYYNTNYPQPTYVSTKHYYLHVDSTAYADFNFKNKAFHELQIWEVPKQIRIEAAPTYIELLEKLTGFLGRQVELPDWIYNGAILGLQGGTERSFALVDRSLRNGIKVSGVWCQDWAGKRVTSFGKRLNWNWKWNQEMYPELPEKIKEYKAKNIRFLAYNNPYLVKEGDLYKEGKEKGYFAKSLDGNDYLVDFGEFDCGVVDFTNPKAYEWFKELIKKHIIEFGIDGWMADFGEYLPTDLQLYNGSPAMIEHNHWPVLWAKCNYEALVETGKLGEIVYFMRAGGAGSQKYCTLLWAGDQSVDFSMHDGLVTVICGALSAAMSGCGLHHSDIGGYTSLFNNCRTKEVFLRWAEMAVFTPVMRTHEGNRPEENFQYYDDADTLEQFARLTEIYTMLAPYIKSLVSINAASGLPVQRPLFLHYENDEKTYDIQTEYLFGEDMLIAPVYLPDVKEWEVYLPNDQWVHLWTGKEYEGGTVTVEAGMGFTPAFYKKNSKYASLFESIQKQYGIK